MTKYNKSEIMKRAHEIRKAHSVTMAEAMRMSWTEAKSGTPVETALDVTAQTLARVRAELSALKEMENALMDELKAAIAANGGKEISGFGWKAIFQTVTSQRFDTKTFKTEHSDLYAQFTRPQTAERFNFNFTARVSV